jgi:hypothetical protein
MNKVGRTLLCLRRALYACNIVGLNLGRTGDVCRPLTFRLVLSLEIVLVQSTFCFQNNHEVRYPLFSLLKLYIFLLKEQH